MKKIINAMRSFSSKISSRWRAQQLYLLLLYSAGDYAGIAKVYLSNFLRGAYLGVYVGFLIRILLHFKKKGGEK